MTGQEDIEVTCFVIQERLNQLGDEVPPLAVSKRKEEVEIARKGEIEEDRKWREMWREKFRGLDVNVT